MQYLVILMIVASCVKDVRENFPAGRLVFLHFLLQSDKELLASEMKKKLKGTDFVSEITFTREENYPDFEKFQIDRKSVEKMIHQKKTRGHRT